MVNFYWFYPGLGLSTLCPGPYTQYYYFIWLYFSQVFYEHWEGVGWFIRAWSYRLYVQALTLCIITSYALSLFGITLYRAPIYYLSLISILLFWFFLSYRLPLLYGLFILIPYLSLLLLYLSLLWLYTCPSPLIWGLFFMLV